MINNMADFTKLNASMPFIAFNRDHFFTAYTQDNKMGMKMAAKMLLIVTITKMSDEAIKTSEMWDKEGEKIKR